ncbi:hypothetical protein [Gloeocapsopsis sp. IPPAS B-1203]|uniref:hypothetical protein n=1 Tax=Gloeocapsopsis sp. IPPAS B-1203 TaxID=2049454 RepID=UPI0025A02D78|nr:hypothetical protein [Gloeocapsopsis sp. IPPAS B-1203]
MSWRLHETTVGRIVRKVEDLLIQCGKFRLPSQRQLYQPNWEWKVMVLDVGEMEIECPQKNRNNTIVATINATHSKHKSFTTTEASSID